MTTYNSSLYIEKQLNSLIKQTLLPDEVIIVDDFSEDNTLEIVEEFIDKHKLENWVLIKSDVNKGYKSSFFKAIKETKGDIIFLCDHDDIWMPDKLKIMSGIMEDNLGILVLNSGFTKINHLGEVIKSKNNIFSTNHNLIRKKIKVGSCSCISLNEVISYNISPGCTSAFNKIIKGKLEKLQGPEYDLVHDWKINIIGATMGGLFFLNEVTTLYRLHSNNAIGLKRNYESERRIYLYKSALEERIYMANIIGKLKGSHNIFKEKEMEKSIKQIDLISKSLIERINALNKRSFLRLFTILFKYKLLKNRMIESWLMDIFIVYMSKRNNQKGLN